MRLTDKDKREVRDSIKEKLEEDFVENKSVWSQSLKEINEYIKVKVVKNLIITPFDNSLLFTYDELCRTSLYVVENIPLKSIKDVDSNTLSSDITDSVADLKILEILEYYFKLNTNVRTFR